MSCDVGMSSLRLACLLYVFIVFGGCAFFKTSCVEACLVMGAYVSVVFSGCALCGSMSCDGCMSSLRLASLLFGGCAFFTKNLVWGHDL
jgi:hypothetical protein